MEPLSFPAGRELLLDSNAIIYSVEQAEPYWSLLQPLWQDAAQGRLRLIGSEIVIPEVLAKPLTTGDDLLIGEYQAVLTPPSMTLYPVDRRILQRDAQLRAGGHLGTPDAIIASTAVARGAALITNDRRLASFKEVEVVFLKDRVT